MSKKFYLGFICSLVTFGITTQVTACTTVLVGKGATNYGSTIIARNEDADTAWAKHFIVHQASDNNSTQHVSQANGFTVSLPQKKFTLYEYARLGTKKWTKPVWRRWN
jgi:dipeptidase